MKVHFNVTWGKNELFNAGQRDFTMEWKQGQGIPREGEAIDIPTFIRGGYTSEETFMHDDTVKNVFDWIQNTTGWEVEKLHWVYENGAVALHILVTDTW